MCRTVRSSLAASLEPLAHHRNVASLSLCYNFGRCSSELAELVPLPYSRGRSTCYYSDRLHDFSDRLHDFSATIPRCQKMSTSTVSFLTQTLELSAHRMLSFDL